MLTLSEIRARYGLPSDSGVLGALSEGQTLPAPLYWAPEVHQLEQETVFARSWQYACHESRLARPGDTVLAAAGGIPLVITRDSGGELRAFVNVCRHRLHPVVTENGNTRQLRCSYHGWTASARCTARARPTRPSPDRTRSGTRRRSGGFPAARTRPG